MSTLKRKFALISRLQALGFTFDESQELRRIEMTLSRWAEAEANGEIERNEVTGKPERNSRAWIDGRSEKRVCWPCADREAGALKRLGKIVAARNTRNWIGSGVAIKDSPGLIYAYHQTDPRGCSLYLVQASDLPETTDDAIRRHSGEWPLKSEATRIEWKLSCYYSRGLAVCA